MMRPFCGRCGQQFVTADLTVVIPGRVRRHYVICFSWALDWARLRAAFSYDT